MNRDDHGRVRALRDKLPELARSYPSRPQLEDHVAENYADEILLMTPGWLRTWIWTQLRTLKDADVQLPMFGLFSKEELIERPDWTEEQYLIYDDRYLSMKANSESKHDLLAAEFQEKFGLTIEQYRRRRSA